MTVSTCDELRSSTSQNLISFTNHQGVMQKMTWAELANEIVLLCADIESVDIEKLISALKSNVYQGMKQAELDQALQMVARSFVEQHPNYTYLASRLLLSSLYAEVADSLAVSVDQFNWQNLSSCYQQHFKNYIQYGIQVNRLSKNLEAFDLERLSQVIDVDRDKQFQYLGLRTLYDRYFLHHQDKRFELPQWLFMRVAMGLAVNEEDKNEKAIEFYHVLSKFEFMSSTPTLFNAGTCHPQLSSCYLTTLPDDLSGIFDGMKDNAMLSKFAGGLGNDWTQVRALNSTIHGTNGKSQGVIPFLKVANDTTVAVNQGGKRKGATCAYLEIWHLDVEAFLELRKNTGDDRRRTHDMNTAAWIPDLFMQRVKANSNWSLFSPDETPDLHDLTGQSFKSAYEVYEQKLKVGEIKGKQVAAKTLWRKLLTMLFETGHPWITFKDACNLRSPQQHVGVVHSSNLCTEITLNTNEDEIAVCNLGSVNLVQHMNSGGLDHQKLQKTIRSAIRMLDNVIDINFYPVDKARNANLKHRPIGLGLMGFQDALYLQETPYSTDAAVMFADTCMEAISFYALEVSADLAKERGSYASFKGSLWSQGVLPIDSIDLLEKSRGEELRMDKHQRLDWACLREKIKSQGMRNSNTLAIAPTATIANICGVSASIEPTYQNIFVKANLSGDFTVINPYLAKKLAAIDLWDKVMVNDLKYHDGSVQEIERVPQDIKRLFATAFEVDSSWLIKAAAKRQKWIDQSQSLNLYLANPSGKKLAETYLMAWEYGLKTTYYLRTLGATHAEKSTLHTKKLNAVNVGPASCALDDLDCEACQ